jgi:hypothetical protein
MAASAAVSAPEAWAESALTVTGDAMHHTDTQGYAVETYNGTAPGFSYTNPQITSAITGSALATFGQLSLINNVSIPDGNGEQGHSTISSSWVDSVLISSPGLDGTTGTLNAVVYLTVDYSRIGTPQQYLYDLLAVEIGDGSPTTSYAHVQYDYGVGLPVTASPINFSIEFTFGEAFNFNVSLLSMLMLNANNGDGATVTTDVNLDWGGVVSVQNASSQPLAPGTFTMTSESGTDWLQAVPEPSTALLVLGAVGLAGLRRQMRARC